jgi:hypothetical protein
MDLYNVAVIFFLGLGVSFFSGFLGIGGGIIMTPALLYLLPAVGGAGLDMKTVTGLTITQGLFACLSGAIRHGKYSFVSRPLVIYMGSAILASALTGAIISRWVHNNVLVGIFASLALAAAVLMFIPQRRRDDEVSLDEVNFRRGSAIAVAAMVGLLGGMVGQGGSFILIPLMLFVLKIPTRIALGSNLAIVFISSAAGFAGKIATGQVPLLLAAALVVGALPGAQIGGYVSKRTRPVILRVILACVIAFAAARMWYDIFTNGF